MNEQYETTDMPDGLAPPKWLMALTDGYERRIAELEAETRSLRQQLMAAEGHAMGTLERMQKIRASMPTNGPARW